jgi:hypothetical protein
MRRRRFLVLGLLVLPCCLAKGSPLPPDRKGSGTYQISGVALNSRSGDPIPFCLLQIESSQDADVVVEPQMHRPITRRGMRVVAEADFGGRAVGDTPDATEVQADAHGRFKIDVTHAGRWSLSGSARGFRRQNYDMHEDFFSSIVLSPATPAMDVTLRLQPDAEISGVITDEAGEPVRDAQVAIEMVGGETQKGPGTERVNARQVGFAQTDDRGVYEVAGLAPGAYRVRIQAQPWYARSSGKRIGGPGLRGGGTASSPLDPSLDVVYPMLWFPGVEQEEQAEIIRLTGAEDRQADFHLQPLPASHVHFNLPEIAAPVETGRPNQQSGISITRVSPSNGFGQNVFGNADGDFGGLSPGTYEVRIQGGDGRPAGEARQIQILPGSAGVIDLSSAPVLTEVKVVIQGVADDATGDVIFTDVVSGRAINATRNSGRVMMARVFSGPAGPALRAEAASKDPERSVSLVPGRYAVSVGGAGQSFVSSLKVTGAQAAGLVVQVDGGSPVVTVQVASGKAQVSGFARIGGVACAGAMVLLVSVASTDELAMTPRDQTNTDGSFSLRGVIPGRYILVAINHGWDVNWHDPSTLAMYLLHGVPMEIAGSSKVVREIEAQKP